MSQDNSRIPWPVWAFVTILTAVIGAYTAFKIAENGKPKPPDAINPLVPNVIGLFNVKAYEQLRAAKFTVRQVREPSTTIDACNVIRTDPAANTNAPPGSAVIIYVSSGPPHRPGEPAYGCPPIPPN